MAIWGNRFSVASDGTLVLASPGQACGRSLCPAWETNGLNQWFKFNLQI